MNYTLHEGDCLEILPSIESGTVQTCVTSPPYFGLRDYGHDQQIGLERTPEEYIDNLVQVFREVRRVLREDGTLWLNLGDSYANDGKWGGHSGGKHAYGLHGMPVGRNKRYTGLKPKDLIGIPWRVALALQADGWWLRQDIIWCLSEGTRIYARTQKGEMPMTIKDMVRLDPSTVQLWNGEKWTQVLGWNETPRPEATFEIELRSGERIGCTAGHLWPTQRGNVRADEIAVGDEIQTITLPEPPHPAHAPVLDRLVAWFVGLYIAEGSMSGDTIQVAGHKDERERLERLQTLAGLYGGTCAKHETGGNSATINLHGPVLRGIIEQYVSGKGAQGKHLDVRVWQREASFLRGILDGYLDGDGHYDAPNKRITITTTRPSRSQQRDAPKVQA